MQTVTLNQSTSNFTQRSCISQLNKQKLCTTISCNSQPIRQTQFTQQEQLDNCNLNVENYIQIFAREYIVRHTQCMN